MKQNHRAVVDVFDYFIFCIVVRRLATVVPVSIGKAPKNSLIAHVVYNLKTFSIKPPLGWTKILRHFFACKLLVCFGKRVYFPFNFLLIDTSQILMIIGVVANEMSLVIHSLYQITVVLDQISQNKKRTGHLLLLQRVENS